MENCGRFVFYNNIYFFDQKPKTKQPALLDRLLHFHVYTLIDHSSRPISAQGFAQLL